MGPWTWALLPIWGKLLPQPQGSLGAGVETGLVQGHGAGDQRGRDNWGSSQGPAGRAGSVWAQQTSAQQDFTSLPAGFPSLLQPLP